jgi:CubicO group peptidase (beta-lactamase class C family)
MIAFPAAVLRPALRLVVAALLCIGAARVAHADNATISPELLAATRHAVSELIRQEMKSAKTAGLSLALVDDQKILWAEGFGVTDRARRTPARADTLYVTGGLSQLFTATAILQLAEQGALDLDQPLHNVLPGFSIRTRFANSPAITPRHLLAHLSGLPGLHLRDMLAPKPEPLAAFVARLRDEYTAAPPGLVYAPSFPGYDVLGRVLEVKCGKPFATCMQERVLAPLGMTHSTFDIAHADRKLFAMHYWAEKPMPSQTVRDVPAAGLASSVTELARFVQMLFAQGRLDGQQILTPHSVREMLRPQNTHVALDLDNRVALPWRLAGVNFPQARTVAWLNNDSPFARGRILIVPEHKLGVIVLTNNSGSSEAVEKVSERLLELLLQPRKPAPPATSVPALTAASKPPRREDVEGNYATLLGLISVKAAGSRYRAQMLGKTIQLTPGPEGLLTPGYRLLGLIPIPISALSEARITMARIGGRPLVIAYFRSQAYRLGERIAPLALSPAWRRRLGDYQSVERDSLLDLVKFGNVSLVYKDGLLYFHYRVPGWLGLTGDVPVRPVSDTELVVDGTGWLMGDTVHVAQRDRKEVLRYSGYEFRRVGAAPNP